MNYIIIKALLDIDVYNRYFQYLALDFYRENNREVYRVLLTLSHLFKDSPKTHTVASLAIFFHSQYPNLNQDDKTLYDALFQKVEEAEVDNNIVTSYFEKHREQSLAAQVALRALDIARGKGEYAELCNYVAENESVSKIESTEKEDLFITDDLSELYKAVIGTHGLRWRLDTLNKMLGSLRKGNFGFIFARPETGKTTFLASEITYMAEQLAQQEDSGYVLWFNNEEVGENVKVRCYQGALGVTDRELFSNLDEYQQVYEQLLKGKLLLFKEPTITKIFVETMCKEYPPSLIVFDQIDKIVGFNADRPDLVYKSIYQWARSLAKTYCPVIGICQAGSTGDGKKWLGMNDVDGSHTAKQGEADFMLGIGKTFNEAEEFVRYLYASKNKLSGDEDTIKELRHGKMSVTINPEIARYLDNRKWE